MAFPWYSLSCSYTLGTPAERGLAHWNKLRGSGLNSTSPALAKRISKIYDLPIGMNLINRYKNFFFSCLRRESSNCNRVRCTCLISEVIKDILLAPKTSPSHTVSVVHVAWVVLYLGKSVWEVCTFLSVRFDLCHHP